MKSWVQSEQNERGHGVAVVFKHSTQCPISAAAYREVVDFEQESNVPIYLIKVIEERPQSLAFADEYKIRHQSPQALVLKDNQVVWHASHYDISVKSLRNAVSEAAQS